MSTWPQCAMVYDGTFTGFLTCVGESFRTKEYPFYFLPPGSDQISLYPLREVPSDPALARTVYRALEEQVSPDFRRMMTYAFLTCLPQKERRMFDVIYLGFLQALPQDLTDDRVLILTRAIRHLTGEAHQYKGFLRFSDYGGVL
ncbi:MAG: DNA metabolism protein, partial [Evtepia sp.]